MWAGTEHVAFALPAQAYHRRVRLLVHSVLHTLPNMLICKMSFLVPRKHYRPQFTVITSGQSVWWLLQTRPYLILGPTWSPGHCCGSLSAEDWPHELPTFVPPLKLDTSTPRQMPCSRESMFRNSQDSIRTSAKVAPWVEGIQHLGYSKLCKERDQKSKVYVGDI
jgi:hypothetical protein